MLLGEYASTVPKSPLEFSKTIEASNGQGCESKQVVAWDAPKTFPFASLISTITDSSGTLARPLILTGDEICDLPFGAVISTPKFTEDVSAPACGWTLGRGPFVFDSPKVEGKLAIGLGAGDGVSCVWTFCFCHAQYIPAEPTATRIIITKATIRLFLIRAPQNVPQRRNKVKSNPAFFPKSWVKTP